ncbi:Elongation factor Tu GTP binding domain protein [Theileria parva strain Muguga]|uniref:Translation elongation factor EF-1, subunit alpha, putative n=1 Tax=Theileria parva TaxID=5875 RepID=Q4N252_THEPA|nr:translation elongation factor EF-1 subunit alpha [Theileria parva strain Muguga]EAN31866.1 Elongation factor Tu GTP binding domain protein [Theileria parva strain Muguga]|eukprot:XP_764149.1 translation elongation factor EF-1 subunit alpha [Theileria parva strain Muguga]
MDSEKFSDFENDAENYEYEQSFKFNPDAQEFKPRDSWLDEPVNNTTYDSPTLGVESLKIREDSSAEEEDSWDNELSDSQKESLVKKKEGKESALSPPDSRPHLNIVFIGHIDAGKSTTCGNILYLSGYVDDRTIEKYGKEAKEKNRESWFLAFIMDTNEEERERGKTIEVGRAKIETKNRRFTILDAPGHRNYVPNMIDGATQADCGVLIISARKGEFETGFERGGQTREHALLAKTLGVSYLIVAINKMDDSTCNWSKERYEGIIKKLKPFLKTCGFTEGKDLSFVPISGLLGQNLIDHISDVNYKHYDKNAAWYDTSMPTLFQLLDNVPTLESDENAPLRIPVIDTYRENGLVCLGKVESGVVKTGQNCVVVPNKSRSKVTNIYFESDEYSYAKVGENIRIRLSTTDEENVSKGSVICNLESPCPVVLEFTALISIIDLLEHRPLVSSGYYCMFHAHCVAAEVKFLKLLETVDKATKKKKPNPVFVSNNSIVTAHLLVTPAACLEKFADCPQLGRFTLRDEDKTIGIGKVLEILKTE